MTLDQLNALEQLRTAQQCIEEQIAALILKIDEDEEQAYTD